MGRKTKRHGSDGGVPANTEEQAPVEAQRSDAAPATDAIADMTPQQIGATGELIAASYLEERGYDILEHGYRCSEGEADLIAYDFESNEIVLVEVKSRRARARDDLRPEEAVDERKRERYRRIASCYLMDRFPVMAIRFDVVSIVFRSGMEASIKHFYSVFDWEAC